MSHRRASGFRRHDAAGVLPPGPMILLFLLAFVLRLAHVLAMRQSPYFNHPIIDAQTYHDAALAIATGHGHPDRVFWQPPGYSYFLALLYRGAGSANFLLPRIAQAALGAASAVLTAWIGARYFGERAGLAAGAIVAVYGTLVYFDGELLGTSLTVFLQLSAMALAVAALDAGRRGRRGRGGPVALWSAAGFVTGLASLVTATSLLSTGLFAFAARRRFPAVILAAALAIAPATVRNMKRGHEFVPISANAGINLYIGNNPRYDQTVAIRPDRVWIEFTREPFEHGIRTQSGSSNYWAGRVAQWAATDPVGFLRLQVKKLRLLLGGDEIYRNQAIYPARRYSPVLAALLWKIPGLAFPFGVLAPFGILGIAVAWRRAPLLAALVALYGVGVLAFFIAARYRVPMVPYLAIFAVPGVLWLGTPAPRLHRWIAVVGLAGLLILCNADQGRMSTEMNADAEFSLGSELHAEGKAAEARAHYRNALRERRDYLEAWVNLGVLEAKQQNYEEGSRAFEEALRVDPRDPTALLNLGIVREHQGRWLEAGELYQRAAAANPRDPYPAQRLASLRERGLLGQPQP